jgi:hypothetical protein
MTAAAALLGAVVEAGVEEGVGAVQGVASTSGRTSPPAAAAAAAAAVVVGAVMAAVATHGINR